MPKLLSSRKANCCCITGCNETTNLKCFPQTKRWMDVWCEALSLDKNLVCKKWMKICYRHFDDKDVTIMKQPRRDRNKNVIQSVKIRKLSIPKLIKRERLQKQAQYKRISIKTLDTAADMILGSKKIHSERHNSMMYCNRHQTDVQGVVNIHNPSTIMSAVRHAILRHRWDDVAHLLPYFNSIYTCKKFVWKTALQVFCNHPESKSDNLMTYLRVCLSKTTVTDDILKSLFCVPHSQAESKDDAACDTHDKVNGTDSISKHHVVE